MKFYISEYALSKGIFTIEAESIDKCRYTNYSSFNPKFCHETLEAALADAESILAKRIELLESKIKNLKKKKIRIIHDK